VDELTRQNLDLEEENFKLINEPCGRCGGEHPDAQPPKVDPFFVTLHQTEPQAEERCPDDRQPSFIVAHGVPFGTTRIAKVYAKNREHAAGIVKANDPHPDHGRYLVWPYRPDRALNLPALSVEATPF